MDSSTQVALYTAFFSLILGLQVWVRGERTRTTLPFSLVCLSVAVFCAGKAFAKFGWGLWFAQLAGGGGLFTLVGFFYLFVVYLGKEGRFADFSVVAAYAFAAIGSVLLFIPSLSELNLINDSIKNVITTVLIMGFSTFFIIWIGKNISKESAVQHKRMLQVLSAFILMLTAIFIAEKWFNPMSIILPWTLLALCLFLYFLHQVVVGYRFFGLRELVGKSAVVAVSALFLAVVYSLFIYLVGTSLVGFVFHTLVAAFLLLILYEPLLSRVEAGTLRWLFRAGSDKRLRFSGLAQNLAHRINVDDVLEFLDKEVPKELGFRGSAVYFLKEENFTGLGEGANNKIFQSPLLKSLLQSSTRPVFLYNLRRQAFDRYPGKERDTFLGLVDKLSQIPASVIFPLRYQDALLGFWAIDTTGGPELKAETGEVLMTLANQATLRIENAGIYQKLKIQDRLATVGEMAAGLAHEIRNPLGSMKGAAEYLKDEPMPEGSQEFVQIIIEEAGRLNDVLGRFLDFARPFKINLQKTNVNELVARIVALIQADPAAQGVELFAAIENGPVVAVLDDELIRQVLINLAKNGIEAMNGQGKLVVAVREDDSRVLIEVKDQGPGISPEKIGRLFEPFFSTKKGGTGLGLAISQRICEAHGGTLLVSSTTGKGSCFSVSLPLNGPVGKPDKN